MRAALSRIFGRGAPTGPAVAVASTRSLVLFWIGPAEHASEFVAGGHVRKGHAAGMGPADARRLAHKILEAVDAVEGGRGGSDG